MRQGHGNIRLNVILFLATVLSAFHARLHWRATDKMVVALSPEVRQQMTPEAMDDIKDDLLNGLFYCGTLMAILLSHELGHFFACYRHRIRASLPFFIPFPNIAGAGNGLGTLGAVIMMDERIPNRKALFDVGAAGPLAGIIVSLPALVIGVQMGEVVEAGANTPGLIIPGRSILIGLLARWFHGPLQSGEYLQFGPVGFAAWVGIFITGINLIPLGQLDGGHVAYSLLGRRANALGPGITLLAAVVCPLLCPFPWLVLLFLVLVSTGIYHRQTLDDESPIGWPRRLLGLLVLIAFVLTFVPRPFSLT